MNIKEFAFKLLLQFLVLVTCITIAMGILGVTLDPERQFGYGAHFAPLIYAAIAVALELITYSRKELTVRQLMIRKVLRFIAYEIVVLTIVSQSGDTDILQMIALAVCIPIVAIIAGLILWIIDGHKAKQLEKDLEIFKRNMSAKDK